MDLRGERVLVTGAGGFIGSHLVEHLVRHGCQVRALVHYDARPGLSNLDLLPREVLSGLDVVAGDVTDASAVRRAIDGCGIVFHLAALVGVPYSYVAPGSYVATNVVGTLNVLEACRDQAGPPRLVHASTSECYGSAQTLPITEDHPLRAQSPYAASKIGADRLVESYHRSFGLPATVLRPFNNFGPRQSARAVIPAIASQLLWGGDVVRLGALAPKRDFLFVEDTCAAFRRAAEADEAVGRTIQVGTGESIAIGALASLLMEVTNIEKPVEQDPERVRPDASEVDELLCDPARARALLGWEPMTGLREGLERVVAFMTSNRDRYRGVSYAI
jgi:NAD dependent epimerase/dehydratase